MTRLWFFNSFSNIYIERVLCSPSVKCGYKQFSSLSDVSFKSRTVSSLNKTNCRLLCRTQKNVDSYGITSIVSSYLSDCRKIDIRSYSRFRHTIITPNGRQDAGAGHHYLLLLSCNQTDQRRKYRSRKSEESSSSDEESEESDEDDDNDFPPGYKDKKAFVKSLRADAIVSSGLNLSRNTVDDVFYKSSLRLNGAKLLKKSKALTESDYVDMIVERNEDKLKVKRVKLVMIYPERTQKERLTVKLRVWKAAFEVEDEDKKQW